MMMPTIIKYGHRCPIPEGRERTIRLADIIWRPEVEERR